MTTHTREISYDPDAREFALYLDGELVGFARTYQQGEETLNALVYELLTRAGALAPAEVAELVPDPATWEAVSEPRCDLCGEPAVLVGEQWTCPECSPISEPALCCERCGNVTDEVDAQLVDGQMWCLRCAIKHEAERLAAELTQVHAALHAATDRPALVHVLTLARDGLITRIKALGYEPVNNGGGIFILFRPGQGIVTVALPRVEAA